MRQRIACDVGGTFTDVVVRDAEGALALFKTPTTAHDGGLSGIRAGLELAEATGTADQGPAVAQADVFVHATTRPLNAILQGATARTVFVTTAGHRDMLFLREGGRSSFRHHTPYPAPYVPRRLTVELPERIGPEGQVLRALDEDETRSILRGLRQVEPAAVAVCLLWSMVNPVHEEIVGSLIEEELPGVHYSLSHRVNPIIREYRRASATAIDASLKPLMSTYLAELDDALRASKFDGELLCASCTGTMLPISDVAASPVHAVQSGPALAPVAALKLAERNAASLKPAESIVVVDAGGTSFDITIADHGELPLTSEYWLGPRFTGHMLGLPAVEVRSIGAGGGSIAWLDPGDLLRVGPRSAGADPGPACYGKGGEEPTLTDAAVVLGYLNPDYFLGGHLPLEEERSILAIAERIAQPLGIETAQAADAIFGVSVQQMSDAIDEITVSQGVDPREALIVAGGGASGFVADRIAAELAVPEVLIPRAAPALAACGGGFVELARDFRRTYRTDTLDFDFDGVGAVLEQLRKDADAFLERFAHEPGTPERDWYVGARYGHQRWELDVPLADGRLASRADVDALVDAFHRLHERVHAVKDADQFIECISWRVRATLRPHAENSWMSKTELGPPRTGSRRAYFRGHGWRETRVVGGTALHPGASLEGPLLVEEPATTVIVSPGSRLDILPSCDMKLWRP